MSPNLAAEFLLMALNHLFQSLQLILFPILLAISRHVPHGLCHAFRSHRVLCSEVPDALGGHHGAAQAWGGMHCNRHSAFLCSDYSRSTEERQACVFVLMP